MTVYVERRSDGSGQDRCLLTSDYDYDLQEVVTNWHVLTQLVGMDPNILAHLNNWDGKLPNLFMLAEDIVKAHYVLRQAALPIWVSNKKIKMVRMEDVFSNIITLEQIQQWQKEAKEEEEKENVGATEDQPVERECDSERDSEGREHTD